MYAIEVVCAAILLALAAWMLRPHPEADHRLEAKVRSHTQRASRKVFAGLAAYTTLTDFSTLVLVLPALHDATRSAVPMLGKAAVVAFVFLCAMLPVLAPTAAVSWLGDRGLAALNPMYSLLMGQQVQVMGAVAGQIGGLLLIRGLGGLQGDGAVQPPTACKTSK